MEIVKPVETVVGRIGLTICFDVSSLLPFNLGERPGVREKGRGWY